MQTRRSWPSALLDPSTQRAGSTIPVRFGCGSACVVLDETTLGLARATIALGVSALTNT